MATQRTGYKNLSTEEEASVALSAILKQADKSRAGTKPAVPTISVQEARTKPLVTLTTGRRTTRVLFVTTDTAILTQATTSLDGFTAIADMFDEVYIMVLRTGMEARHPVLRVATQTWLYTVTAKHDWQLPIAAIKMMQSELFFAEGFRPDLIVARDQHISAVTVYIAGTYFKRPIQLHLPERPTKIPAFRLFGQWASRQFLSIRTNTAESIDVIKERYRRAIDVRALPKFRDYVSHFTGLQSRLLALKYPQFNFFVLYVGSLAETTAAFQAIDAARDVLRNPRVGFIMVGDGSGVMECHRRAELFGIKDQVIIEKRVTDLTEYFASADVLLVTDSSSDADEVVLWGAAAGLPMVMTDTSLRRDLFIHDTSAFIVGYGHIINMSDYLRQLLNDNIRRANFRYQVRLTAEERLYIDPSEYRLAYRDSLEQAITVAESA